MRSEEIEAGQVVILSQQVQELLNMEQVLEEVSKDPKAYKPSEIAAEFAKFCKTYGNETGYAKFMGYKKRLEEAGQ